MLTVGLLREWLANLLRDGEVTDDTEVRLAHQPSWALEYGASREVGVAKDNDGDVCVYLAEGRQIGYLPHEAAVAIGWSEEEPDEDDDEEEG